MYLAVCTRPDLAMAVSALSRFCKNPQPEHWGAGRRVLRYLKGTAREGLGYSPGEGLGDQVAGEWLWCGIMAVDIFDSQLLSTIVSLAFT